MFVDDSYTKDLQKRAYFLWLNDGCPNGNEWHYWFLAENIKSMMEQIEIVVKDPSLLITDHYYALP